MKVEHIATFILLAILQVSVAEYMTSTSKDIEILGPILPYKPDSLVSAQYAKR